MAVNFLRYPGGKTRARKHIVPILLGMLEGESAYCEPFVGGGSVALAIAEKIPTVRLYLNDKDRGVAALWKTIALGHEEELIERYAQATPSVELFRELKEQQLRSRIDLAFRFLALNRMAFSGKTHTSPIGGWEQDKGGKRGSMIDVEWRIDHVIDGIRKAAKLLAGRTIVTCVDFGQAIVGGAITYLDPPYFEKGRSMYSVYMSPDDHDRLAQILKGMDGWVLSYDNCKYIRRLYKGYKQYKLNWLYSAAGKREDDKTKRELLIVHQVDLRG